jgi:type II secretory pathway component PulK
MTATRARPAFILPVVLVLIGFLALIMAGFMFFVRAELAGVQAERDSQQARLAAESGLQEVITVLRTARDDPNAWWDKPDRFRHVLVWSEGYKRNEDPVKKMGNRLEILHGGSKITPAWRYSVVAENLDGLPDTMRYGITPEASKLNLNTASEQEIEALLLDVLPKLGIENAQELIAALLDWMDPDDDTRSGGAETDYYSTLKPGYKAKNGPLDTIDELLLVKGFSAAILYGEDTNRNGILDRNEDDGTASFPYYDNADGILDRGLAPYITVWSKVPGATQAQGPSGASGPSGAAGPSGASGPAGTQPAARGNPRTAGSPRSGSANPDKDSQKQKAKDQSQTRDDTKGAAGDPNTLLGAAGAAPQGATGPGTGETGDPTGAADPNETAGPTGASGPSGASGQAGAGLINVNTASARVLRAIGISAEEADKVVAQRTLQDPETLKTTDWLVASEALTPETYAAVKDRLTTRAYQFHVEIVGYADHTPLARRYEWIIEMRGPAAQVLYHRDLTSLGIAWPLDDEKVLVQQR